MLARFCTAPAHWPDAVLKGITPRDAALAAVKAAQL
jgi:hypothetical protein